MRTMTLPQPHLDRHNRLARDGHVREPVPRVLVVDDHQLFGEAVALALEQAGMEILKVASNARGALAAARQHRPDVVLLDLDLADLDGMEVGRRILRSFPATKVIALADQREARAVRQALHIGFCGYLTKKTPLAQLVRSIRSAIGGLVVVPHETSDAESQLAVLSPREREVLSHLVEGLASREIARRLSLSRNTIRTHVSNILAKLEVHSRLEAVALARRLSLVEAPASTSAIQKQSS